MRAYPLDRSPVGVYGLAGNVCEWTADSKPNSDPESRLLRGGAFTLNGRAYGVTYVRTLRAKRLHRDEDVGFRCVMDPEP